MCNYKILAALLLLGVIPFRAALLAQDKQENQDRVGPAQAGWSTFSRGGVVYQFDTDLDDGGSYSASRFNIQAGQGYGWDSRTSVSVALSYSYDDYSFSKGSGIGIASLSPWDSINSFSLSSPMRLGLDDSWSAFLIPSVRSSGGSPSLLATFRGTTLPGRCVRATTSSGLTESPTLTITSPFSGRIRCFLTNILSVTFSPGVYA